MNYANPTELLLGVGLRHVNVNMYVGAYQWTNITHTLILVYTHTQYHIRVDGVVAVVNEFGADDIVVAVDVDAQCCRWR